jgi:nitrous oxidase accessory protein NosD
MVNNQHHKRLWTSTFIVFVMILSVVSVGRVSAQQQSAVIPNQPAQNGGSEISCGQTVQGNVTLTANLNCNGDGLIVGDDATTINLNGFGIYGPGADNSKVGIGITEDNVVINGPGIVSGFEAGVLLTGASEFAIHALILQDNEIGIFLTGGDLASVEENIIRNNNIAVASHSGSGISIESNLMDANARAGVTFVNTDESVVNSNSIQGAQNGIFLDAQSSGNTVQLNNANDNIVDLNNANGEPPTINQNTFSDNNCLVSDPGGLCLRG